MLSDNYELCVSIAVPIYNVSKYFERCLISLFEQTYNNIEYVFVNDGSTDNSMEILRETLESFPQRKHSVTIIDRKRNLGVASTRNELLENCTGGFISFVDADDYIDENIIELLVNAQKETNADIVSSGFFVLRNGEKILIPTLDFSSSKDNLDYILTHGNSHELYCRIFRREMIVKNNLTFIGGLNIGEDWLFMVKCLFFAKIVTTVKECGYHYYCDNSTSLMSMHENIWQPIEDLKLFLEIDKFLKSVNYNFINDFHIYVLPFFLFVKWEAAKKGDKDVFSLTTMMQNSLNIETNNLNIKDFIKYTITNHYWISRVVGKIYN